MANPYDPAPYKIIQPPSSGGLPGPSAPDNSTFQRTVAGAISALRVVWEDASGVVDLLSFDDDTNIDKLAGLTITAAGSSGQVVKVQRTGVVNAGGLGLSVGRVWLGNNGQLTQIAPTTGYDILVGYAVDDSRLYLQFDDNIPLGE